MSQHRVFSPAKLNLNLKILHRREDHYHELESIMAKLSWGDELVFEEKKEGIEIRAEGEYSIPTNADNLVYKAADLLRSRAKGKKGIRIGIKKNIPTGGGLGGGSSNAAYTLKFLNHFWDVNLSKEELMKLGKSLGADVAFFIDDSTFAQLSGIGEKVSSLTSDSISFLQGKEDVELVLVIPHYISIHTAWAYQKMFEYYQGIYPKSEGNTFEEPMFSVYPDLKKIKEILIESGAVYAAMTGSGSVMFGVFEKGEFTKELREKLEAKGKVIETGFFE